MQQQRLFQHQRRSVRRPPAAPASAVRSMLLLLVLVLAATVGPAAAFLHPAGVHPPPSRPSATATAAWASPPTDSSSSGGGRGDGAMRPLLSEGIDVRPAADGLGPGAGRILVAKPWEYNHFTSKSCLFVYQHDPATGTRAVVLERPTAFTLAELAPPFAESVFAEHTVFLGGEQGGDMAVLLHPYEQVPGARPVGGGLYYGGLQGAEALLREQAAGAAEHGLETGKFKWWFNYMSWGPGQLEQQIAGGSWDVVEADPAAVLRQGVALERDLWATLRRHYLPREPEEKPE